MKRERKIYLTPCTLLLQVQLEGSFASSIGNEEEVGAEIDKQPGNEDGNGTIGEEDWGANPWS